MTFTKTLLTTVCATALTLAAAHAGEGRHYKHVLLISVDGLHASDVTRFVADPSNAGSALTQLAAHGTVYTGTQSSGPSDSFPGMLALATGGTPRSTGVYYDNSYDRTLFAPGSNCAGAPGVNVLFAENIDRDPNRLTPAAGGTLGDTTSQIDPAQLPMAKTASGCKPVYPHDFVRANTIFEVIREAGMRTAWADKHPAYDILNGPSGKGVTDLFTPEVDSVIPGTAPSKATSTTTNAFAAIRGNDELKVKAVLNEIGGKDSTGTKTVGVPAVLGMNFQSVSVGQKLAMSGPTDPAGLKGGYLDANYTPGNALTGQLAYVDGAIGRMLAALSTNGLANDTLVIVTAKHGQSPVDVTLRQGLDDGPYGSTPGIAQFTTDDVALIWLTPQTRKANLAAAYTYLQSQASTLQIKQILTPSDISRLFRNPARDARAPDFLAITQPGVIYTGGTKLAEHGGFAFEDRNVGLIVSAPNLQPTSYTGPVTTTQVAPTILRALDLDPSDLDAVEIEHTKPLPGLVPVRKAREEEDNKED